MIKGIESARLLCKSVKENFSVCCFSLGQVGSMTFKGEGEDILIVLSFFGWGRGGGPHCEDCGILAL